VNINLSDGRRRPLLNTLNSPSLAALAWEVLA
jgi:hypothetical protein